jgi:NAD(P)-dependent dehydrogenase (short-subunit alcohol dehydrogenase family)
MGLDHVQDNIRVNCVAPGTVETLYFTEIFAKSQDPATLRKTLEARQPLNRLGKPEEVTHATLYLALDESSFVTGTMLVVDGGWTAR